MPLLIVSMVIRDIGVGGCSDLLHLDGVFFFYAALCKCTAPLSEVVSCADGEEMMPSAFFFHLLLLFSVELSCSSCFAVGFIVVRLCLQHGRSPDRGVKTAGGKMAGDAEQLGQVDGQETQEGLSNGLKCRLQRLEQYRESWC